MSHPRIDRSMRAFWRGIFVVVRDVSDLAMLLWVDSRFRTSPRVSIDKTAK